MPYLYRTAALCGLLTLAVAATGCDSGDDGDDGISEDTLDELADLVGCDVEAMDLDDTVTGTIEDDDCTLEEVDADAQTFSDFYAFRVVEDTDVQIDLEGEEQPTTAEDYDPLLVLLDQEGDIIATNDDIEFPENFYSRIEENLNPGIYVVAASTAGEDQVGEYTLRVRDEGSDED